MNSAKSGRWIIPFMKLFKYFMFSDPGCGTFHAMETNHINICKPKNRESELYILTLSFIRKCIFHHSLNKAKNKVKDKLDIKHDSLTR